MDIQVAMCDNEVEVNITSSIEHIQETSGYNNCAPSDQSEIDSLGIEPVEPLVIMPIDPIVIQPVHPIVIEPMDQNEGAHSFAIDTQYQGIAGNGDRVAINNGSYSDNKTEHGANGGYSSLSSRKYTYRCFVCKNVYFNSAQLFATHITSNHSREVGNGEISAHNKTQRGGNGGQKLLPPRKYRSRNSQAKKVMETCIQWCNLNDMVQKKYYSCKECRRVYLHETAFLEHYKRYSIDGCLKNIGTFSPVDHTSKCVECETTLVSKEELHSHYQEQHSYTCGLCDKTHINRKSVEYHLFKAHHPRKLDVDVDKCLQFTCGCGKKYRVISLFRKHLNSCEKATADAVVDSEIQLAVPPYVATVAKTESVGKTVIYTTEDLKIIMSCGSLRG